MGKIIVTGEFNASFKDRESYLEFQKRYIEAITIYMEAEDREKCDIMSFNMEVTEV